MGTHDTFIHGIGGDPWKSIERFHKTPWTAWRETVERPRSLQGEFDRVTRYIYMEIHELMCNYYPITPTLNLTNLKPTQKTYDSFGHSGFATPLFLVDSAGHCSWQSSSVLYLPDLLGCDAWPSINTHGSAWRTPLICMDSPLWQDSRRTRLLLTGQMIFNGRKPREGQDNFFVYAKRL